VSTRRKITKEQIKSAIESTVTMAEAAIKLGLHFSTFKNHATRFGLYAPNPGAKGKSKPKREGVGKIPLEEILEGKHPSYQTFKLKLRLFETGLKKNECEICGIFDWLGEPIQCELDHIDGDRTNHRLLNLRVICPNCHSQTETFRYRKRNAPVVERYTQLS
jgi:hypothetical protein